MIPFQRYDLYSIGHFTGHIDSLEGSRGISVAVPCNVQPRRPFRDVHAAPFGHLEGFDYNRLLPVSHHSPPSSFLTSAMTASLSLAAGSGLTSGSGSGSGSLA